MKKIAVIDDDVSIVALVKDIIEMHFKNVTVYEAYDGNQGYDVITQKHPDLIILDINIPHIDGFGLCEMIKKDKELSRIPVLIMTGTSSIKQGKTTSLNIGADAYLRKPFELEEFVAQVKSLMKLKTAEDNLVKQRDLLMIDVNIKDKELSKSFFELKELYDSFVEVMATAIDSLSIYNYNSTKKIAGMVKKFTDYLNSNGKGNYKHLKITKEQAENLVTAAWLHDIGKILLPVSLMNKTTRLGASYATLMQRLETVYFWAKALKPELLDRIRKAKEAVSKYNNPLEPVDERTIAYFYELAGLRYQDSEGNFKNWLTSYELECLTVKRGTLTEAERNQIRQHVELTDLLLGKIALPKSKKMIKEWCSGHHELLDGSGYWKGLKGDQIPLETRILTIVDIFEALISNDRAYKKVFHTEEALEHLTEMASQGKLDAELVDLFKNSEVWKGEAL